MFTVRATLFLLCATFVQAQTNTLGVVGLGMTDPNTGQTPVIAALNSRATQSTHLEDVVLDISGSIIHTGPIDLPAAFGPLCSADPNSPCPPPPWRYISVQLQWGAPDSPSAGNVILQDGTLWRVYGIETYVMMPRLGQQYLHLQTVKPNTVGQTINILVHKCPVAATQPVGCQ